MTLKLFYLFYVFVIFAHFAHPNTVMKRKRMNGISMNTNRSFAEIELLAAAFVFDDGFRLLKQHSQFFFSIFNVVRHLGLVLMFFHIYTCEYCSSKERKILYLSYQREGGRILLFRYNYFKLFSWNVFSFCQKNVWLVKWLRLLYICSETERVNKKKSF